jgi:hypothetical protein
MRPTPSIAIALVFAVVCGFGASVWAQGKNPLDAIQNTLNALVESVSAIGEDVAPGNVVVTPALHRTSQVDHSFSCQALNVSDHDLTITIEMFRALDGIRVVNVTFDVAAGMLLGWTTDEFNLTTIAYCKLTIQGGTKNDIRGGLTVIDGLGNILVRADAR